MPLAPELTILGGRKINQPRNRNRLAPSSTRASHCLAVSVVPGCGASSWACPPDAGGRLLRRRPDVGLRGRSPDQRTDLGVVLDGPRHGGAERRRRMHPGPAAGVVSAMSVDVEDVTAADGAAPEVAEWIRFADADEPDTLRPEEGGEGIWVLERTARQRRARCVSKFTHSHDGDSTSTLRRPTRVRAT
jgi:hypothetical protein